MFTASDTVTCMGPFMPLQVLVLWYFVPPFVGIQTSASVR